METKISLIEKIFPEVITEKNFDGTIKKAVDFDKLKEILSEEISDAPESYTFNWVGKNAARADAYRKINKTLRPCVVESKNFDTTENLYIEGDNLEVLKLLQQSYLHKIKMIYIDPPYNTGNDFIYHDKFVTDAEEYAAETKLFDDDGNKNFVENTESNPRFHSDWCSMIYSRLLLARNLLTDDGVIFISIDDNEQANLKKICDEVFGEKNFVAQIIWERAYAPVNLKKHFSTSHDYILCYAKNLQNLICNGLPRNVTANDRYKNPDNDPRGVWKSGDFSVGPIVEKQVYEITTPSGRKVLPPSGRCWRVTKERFEELVTDNRVYFGEDGNNVPSVKRFLSEVKQGMTPMTIWKYEEVGHSQDATKFLKELFDDKSIFTYPKPVELIKRCLELYADKESIVLDFFSGSATTAHAVLALNAEDGGRRRFIMVQLPEKCAAKSEAYKAGYKNICEIGKERIRRAGEKIKSESPLITGDLDVGFRVLKIDETNFKNFSVSPAELTQEMLKDFADNIKADRNALDLLFECLINWGVELHLNHAQETFEGATVHSYAENFLVACFDKNISLEVVKFMAQKNPLRAVFIDACFKSDSDKINAGEIFKLYAPNAKFKVI